MKILKFVRPLTVLIFALSLTGCTNAQVLKTGLPDILVDLQSIVYKTHNDSELNVQVDLETSRLAAVSLSNVNGMIKLPDSMLLEICSPDLFGTRIYRKVRLNENKKAYFSDDLIVSIPFFDLYEGCAYPDDHDELPMTEYELEILFGTRGIIYSYVRNTNSGEIIKSLRD